VADLLDLLRADDPRADLVHVCLPSMGYVCGGSILGLADGGPGGHQVLGVGVAAWTWEAVTCSECRRPGHREVARIQHRQQTPPNHQCSESCAWTRIPVDQLEEAKG